METITQPGDKIAFFKKRPKTRQGARKSKVLVDEASEEKLELLPPQDSEVVLRNPPKGIKRDREGNATSTTSSSLSNIVSFTADRSAVNKNVDDATRTAHSVDAGDIGKEEEDRIIRQKLKNEGALDDESDGIYHGLKTLNKSLIHKKQDSIRAGPVRAPANIRTITLIDYQPDVCKDYKETGYCGFGDSCKFLHDRGDYLSGWQLDKKWDEQQRQNADLKRRFGQLANDVDDEDDNNSDNENIPFACIICRKEYTNPVVTKCKHYFCENCALKRFAKNSKCFACGAPTGGVFNSARSLLSRLEAKKMRQKEESSDQDQENQIQLEGLEERNEFSEEDEKKDQNNKDSGESEDSHSEPNSNSESDDSESDQDEMPIIEYE